MLAPTVALPGCGSTALAGHAGAGHNDHLLHSLCVRWCPRHQHWAATAPSGCVLKVLEWRAVMLSALQWGT